MGAIDDDGIGIGDVQSALHDGGGDQHIIVIVGKGQHGLLQFFGRHLSVSNSHTGIGHMLPDEFCQFRQLADTVVDEEDLSAATHLEADSLCYHFGTECADLCLDGIAVGGWRLNDREVTGSHERELQGARDRRGSQSQRVHVGLQLPELLFRRDTELLFLVDDEQTEVLEAHRLANELVRANDYVHRAVLQSIQHLLRF